MISIIVPVYNSERYLKRCINSILKQTYFDYSLILIDDGSTDNSGSICDEYAENDCRIHVIHQQNGGAASARNAGLDWAVNNKSEWITFVDSDDYIHRYYLECLVKAAVENDMNISACFFQREPFEVSVDYEYHSKVIESKEFFEKNMILGTVCFAKLYKATCLLNDRFPLKKYEDEYFTWKILFRYEKISLVDVPLYVYYTNENSTMRSKNDIEKLLNFDSVDAFVEQALWFRSKNYDYLSKRSARNAVLAVVVRIRDAEKSDCDKRILRILKRRLRNNIRYLKQKRLYMPIEENLWVYKIAFPIKTTMIIYLRDILEKIRCRVNGNDHTEK